MVIKLNEDGTELLSHDGQKLLFLCPHLSIEAILVKIEPRGKNHGYSFHDWETTGVQWVELHEEVIPLLNKVLDPPTPQNIIMLVRLKSPFTEGENWLVARGGGKTVHLTRMEEDEEGGEDEEEEPEEAEA